MTDANQDSIEEVLQQSSEQTLKLTHIDEGVKELKQEVADLGDTLQAGLLEVRNLTASKASPAAQAASGDEVTYRQSVIERLEELERGSQNSARKLGVLMIVSTLSLGMMALLALVAFHVIDLRKKEPIVAPYVQPAVVEPVAAPVKNEKAPEINIGKVKKRR
jgi:hypothetical protein